LFPVNAGIEAPPPLSDAERAQASACRQQAARKLKMARLLTEGGLEEEARAALLSAVQPLGRALAVEHRLPEPATAEEALLAPLSLCWHGALARLRPFLTGLSQLGQAGRWKLLSHKPGVPKVCSTFGLLVWP
jgi:hypothetical protein